MTKINPAGSAVSAGALPSNAQVSSSPTSPHAPTAPGRAPTRAQIRNDLNGLYYSTHVLAARAPYYLARHLVRSDDRPMWRDMDTYIITEKGARVRDWLNREDA